MKKVLLGLFILGSLSYGCDIPTKNHVSAMNVKVKSYTKKLAINNSLDRERENKEVIKEFIKLKVDIIHLVEEHSDDLTTKEIQELGNILKMMENIEKELI
ncbi:MAG: hypothetical protein ACRC7R_01600 [Sarcina sp.]